MFENVLAIIPARGGSKAIKNKNLVKLNNKPLVCHSIELAKKSQFINKIIVSTDSDEIKKISKKFGAEVPFTRPKELATDDATDYVVFRHCLEWLKENQGYNSNLVVHLRPTYPLRDPHFVDNAISQAFENPNFDSMRSVCEPFQNPYKMWTLEAKQLLPFISDQNSKEKYNWPRQKLKKIFWQNGCLDIIKPQTILRLNSISGNKILPIIMDSDAIFDVDDLFSLQLVEGHIKYKNDV